MGVVGIIFWIIALVGSLLEVSLGFMLGYGLIAKYALSKNEAAKEKGEMALAKLRPLQGKLGILAIILGIAYIIMSFAVAAIVIAAVTTA